MHIQHQISLASYNTFGIHAVASHFIDLERVETLKEISLAKNIPEQKYILGGGSNILISANPQGLVIHNCLKGIHLISETASEVVVEVASGENWHQWLMYALQQGWYGLENLALIPGTVGAAPIQNIGAYGAEVKNYISEVKIWLWETQEYQILSASQCQFNYRDSIFKHSLKDKCFICSVTFKLNKKAIVNITYAPLHQEFGSMELMDITPLMVAEAVIRIRKSKLPDPALMGNAGSFFKNPVITEEQFFNLQAGYPHLPFYKQSNNTYKIPAAWLIEQCGWKGYKGPRAGVHDKQALVLVNLHQAKGQDILELANLIIHSVSEKFNISLSPEVQCW
jgi:UDP-N-acetylmuramate dehydrogenase